MTEVLQAFEPTVENDSLLRDIEAAFELDQYIHHSRAQDFVHGLEEVLDSVSALIAAGEAARAEALLKIFMAALYVKVEEVDESGGGLELLAEEVFRSLIRARRAAGRSANEIAADIARRCDADDYMFSEGFIEIATNELQEAELQGLREAFEDRREMALKALEKPATNSNQSFGSALGLKQLVSHLKKIYLKQRDFAAYEAAAQSQGLTVSDCVEAAKALRIDEKREAATEWIKKGFSIAETKKSPGADFGTHELEKLHRQLLVELGHRTQALESAWGSFVECPSRYSYGDLMSLADDDEKQTWHERAMLMADVAEFGAAIGIFLESKEYGKIVERISAMTDAELESTSSYTLDNIAKALERNHPVVAGRAFQAAAFSILESRKTKAYPVALRCMERVRDLYMSALLTAPWVRVVERVRLEHRRKSAFIDAFEEIAAGRPCPRPPTFLDKIRTQLEKVNSGMKAGTLVVALAFFGFSAIAEIRIGGPISVSKDFIRWNTELFEVSRMEPERMDCVDVSELPGVLLCAASSKKVLNLSFARTTVFFDGMAGFRAGSVISQSDLLRREVLDDILGHFHSFVSIAEFQSQAAAACRRSVEYCPNAHEQELFDLTSRVSASYIAAFAVGSFGSLVTAGHELLHAQYALDSSYRLTVNTFWNEVLTEAERSEVTEKLSPLYDVSNRDLLVNEFQAYLFEPAAEDGGLAEDWVPKFRQRLTAYLEAHSASVPLNVQMPGQDA